MTDKSATDKLTIDKPDINKLLLFKIAFKFFKRDWKRGELLVLIFSMVIAMASVSVIYLIIDRIESASSNDVADILGADLVISSPKPISAEWLSFAEAEKLKTATSVEFASVLFANDKLQLASIKAISANYPLRGSLQLADSPYAETREVNTSPARGEVWLEPRILNILSLAKNQAVELGYTDLTVGAVLMRQPGQGTTLFNIAPTAMMNIDDLEATQIIQPGSRVSYRYLFVGPDKGLKNFAAKVEKEKDTSQRLTTIYDESPIAGGALSRSKKYIGLSSLLTLILLGVAIAMSASRYAKKQFDLSALMRCFGLTNNQVLKIFITILSFIALFGISIGGVLGILFQEIFVMILSDFFAEQLPQANYLSLMLPMLSAVILLFGFSLPSIIQIKSVSPMRVLRRQLEPMSLNRWVIYFTAAITLVFVMWLQMEDLKLLLSVLLGLMLVALIFSVFATLVLKIMKKLAKTNHPAVNFSLRQLDANKAMTLLHFLAFSITLFVIGIMILVRTELMVKWQQSLDENTPNHFMVNVKSSEVAELESFFAGHQLTFSGLYPMVRGRIVGLNGQDIETAISEEGQKHNSLQRELNITWSADLPVGNEIVEGQWDWPNQTQDFLISIEDKTALALGLKLGDKLNFTIGSEPWTAKIVSIRSIDWQTFTPNFYIIANPGALNNFESTYIASFYMPPDKKILLPSLVKTHPSITVIEMDLILAEIQSIISKVSRAVELIMIFVVVAGIALLWAAMEHTYESKYKQSAILRTLGASKAFIARSFRFEYLWMALLSSSMAVFAIESVSYLLYTQEFDIPFEFHWLLWWLMPLSTLTLMLVVSWRGVKKVTEPSPLSLIRGI